MISIWIVCFHRYSIIIIESEDELHISLFKFCKLPQEFNCNEDELQISLFKFCKLAYEFNCKVYSGKTEVIAFKENEPARSKFVMDCCP